MADSEKVAFVERLVREKHDVLLRVARSLLEVIAGENMESKKQAAFETNRRASDLNAVLPSTDVPKWLVDLQSVLAGFEGNRITAPSLLGSLIPITAALETQRWVFDKRSEAAFDFDAIFNHYKKESRLPELFDEIIRILEEMHAGGEIDSNAMLSALSKVISTLKTCKDGSYFSLNGAWQFLINFLNNYMWGALAALPALGPALAALDKTIRETETEMSKVHSQVRDELKKSVEGEVKALAGKTAFEFISYDRTGRFSPPMNTPLLPPATA